MRSVCVLSMVVLGGLCLSAFAAAAVAVRAIHALEARTRVEHEHLLEDTQSLADESQSLVQENAERMSDIAALKAEIAALRADVAALRRTRRPGPERAAYGRCAGAVGGRQSGCTSH